MTPPAAVTASCSQGDRAAVALYARRAATGTRMKVCSAFQIRSKAGILSAKNSIPKSVPLAPITHQLASTSNPGGNASTPTCDSTPRVATVAYRFSPAAKLVATTVATTSFAGILVKTWGIRATISRLGYWAAKSKRPPIPAAFALIKISSYKVDSISNPQASSSGSGMYLEFLLRRAHSRRRVDRKYWSGESLYSRTTCSNSVMVGVMGPIGSGLPQFGLPRRLAMKDCLSTFGELRLHSPLTE